MQTPSSFCTERLFRRIVNTADVEAGIYCCGLWDSNGFWIRHPRNHRTANAEASGQQANSEARSCLSGGTAAPILLVPPNGATVDTLLRVFRCYGGESETPTGLGLELALDAQFRAKIRSLSHTPARGEWKWRYGGPPNLEPATTYYGPACFEYDWGGSLGPWSKVWFFATAAVPSSLR